MLRFAFKLALSFLRLYQNFFDYHTVSLPDGSHDAGRSITCPGTMRSDSVSDVRLNPCPLQTARGQEGSAEAFITEPIFSAFRKETCAADARAHGCFWT